MTLSAGFRRAMVSAQPYIEFLREHGVPEDVTMYALILMAPGRKTRVQQLASYEGDREVHPVVMTLARELDRRGGL